MPEAEYLYLLIVELNGCRNIRHLKIDLSPERPARFRHLILTGPNGSGKSGALLAIATELARAATDGTPSWTPAVRLGLPHPAPAPVLSRLWKDGSLVLGYLPAQRTLKVKPVSGPEKIDLDGAVGVTANVSPLFLQFLVNKKIEQAFAGTDGDQATVEGIEAWFAALERRLALIMGDPKLRLIFQRKTFSFRFRRGDGYEFGMDELADGHAAIMAILAAILLRVEAALLRGHPEPSAGIFLIDEIETHLHVRLQQQILPFLIELFPWCQFLIATHSPAVIASVPGAMVYDLERNVGTLSDEFRGVRYGTLMKEHFGIHEDFDQESQTDLEELRRLSALAALTPDEEEKLEALAARPGQPTRCDQDPVGPQSHPVATRSAAQTARIFSGPTLPT